MYESPRYDELRARFLNFINVRDRSELGLIFNSSDRRVLYNLSNFLARASKIHKDANDGRVQ